MVDCKGKKIPNFIPYGIPKEVTALDLSNNLIPSLKSNAFAQLASLKYLDLDGKSAKPEKCNKLYFRK